MRSLSINFFDDLKNGLLQPLLGRVKQDDTLMLAIRDGYINIYYRGGNILRLREQSKGKYKPAFDTQYNKTGRAIPDLPVEIKSPDDVRTWIESLPILKEMMDLYFSAHPKPEREFQQLVARENNDSSISGGSEYFITDIEVADSDLGARFDMLAIRWPASQRKEGTLCRPAFVEMKYADGALDGTAGLIKHLKDFDDFIADRRRYQDLLSTMENQFSQLDGLGLLKFNRGKSNAKVQLNANSKPEVIFILANHNPRSSKLAGVLSNPELAKYEGLDTRFFVASFAGYALHTDSMMSLAEFQALLQNGKRSKPEVVRIGNPYDFRLVSEGEFMTSLDENGRAVFSRILSLAKDKSMHVNWGTKGFSLNINLNKIPVAMFYAFPPSANRGQSIRTTMIGRGRMTGKTAIPENVIEELRQKAQGTGLFNLTGQELKCSIDRTFAESEVTALLSWIEAVATTIRQYGLKK